MNIIKGAPDQIHVHDLLPALENLVHLDGQALLVSKMRNTKQAFKRFYITVWLHLTSEKVIHQSLYGEMSFKDPASSVKHTQRLEYNQICEFTVSRLQLTLRQGSWIPLSAKNQQ